MKWTLTLTNNLLRHRIRLLGSQLIGNVSDVGLISVLDGGHEDRILEPLWPTELGSSQPVRLSTVVLLIRALWHTRTVTLANKSTNVTNAT